MSGARGDSLNRSEARRMLATGPSTETCDVFPMGSV